MIRQGQVYALFDYDAQNDDELTFCEGDLMTVLKRGDNKLVLCQLFGVVIYQTIFCTKGWQ